MTTNNPYRRELFTTVGYDLHGCKSGLEALTAAKLDWRVEPRDLFFGSCGDNSPASMKPIPSEKAFVRTDTEETLAVLAKDFHPCQNEKVLSFFDPFLEAGEATLEFAGAFRGGRTVWCVAKLNKAPIDIGGGDVVQKYLMAANSHDGKMALRVQFLPFRPVCSNVLSRFRAGMNLVRIRHAKGVNDRLDEVQRITNAANAEFEATAEQYQALARRKVNQSDLKKFVKLVFEPHNADEQRKLMALEKMNETITRLFETGAGHELASADGTMWGLYNAATNYLTHEKGRTPDSRLNSACFGENATTAAKAFNVAMEMAVAR